MVVARPPSPRNPAESLGVGGLEEEPRIKSPERALPQRRSTRSSDDSGHLSEPLPVINEARELEESWELDSPSSFPARVLRALNTETNVAPVNDPSAVLGPCERHNAGQYDWILSTQLRLQTTEDTFDSPHPGIWRYYGCNWLVERKETEIDTDHTGLTTVHTLLATELLGDNSSTMTLPDPIVRVISPPASDNIDVDVTDIFVLGSSAHRFISTDASSSGTLGAHSECRVTSQSAESAPASSPASSYSMPTRPQARIEDSVEALDQLEEDLEALQSATRVQSFPSPTKKRQPLVVFNGASNVTRSIRHNVLSDNKTVPGKSASLRVRSTVSRPQLRKSASMDMTDEQALCTMAKKAAVTRPSSLLPPKPPAKSSKAPTKPTFELPGEAVARRLKEQREARRSMQIIPDKAAPSVPQRSKSVRAATIPRFELPGEAISRRKKEQHEKQLREQAEEERKRREFKAAPVRASAAPANYPRETVASRARRVKAAGDDVQEPLQSRASAGSTTASNRSSVIGIVSRPSLRKSASTISNVSTASTSSQSRGRVSTTDESQTSRGTSTSEASPGSKRVPMSAEEVERLRLRGKELYEQDNSYVGERERERRQREMAAKQAREQAAERSRQASREWAERQRRRQSALFAGQTAR